MDPSAILDPIVDQSYKSSSQKITLDFQSFENQNPSSKPDSNVLLPDLNKDGVSVGGSSKITSNADAMHSYTDQSNAFRKQQEELEKKAAELDLKEQQLNQKQRITNVNSNEARKNNWPPLPSFLPFEPCFYQDFSTDIPVEFQQLTKTFYYIWMGYVLVLFFNLISSLAYFITGGNGTTFGLSLLWFVLWTPASFICWYRPVYKAFRSDSSFNFFLFFFMFFFQCCVNCIQSLGIDSFGTSGWINALGHVRTSLGVSCLMFLVALGFDVLAGVSFIYLFKVHGIYRGSGASFAKAQQEFTTDILSNKAVQNVGWSFANNLTNSKAYSNQNRY